MKKQKPSFTAFLIPKLLPALASNKKYSSLLTQQQVDISRHFARECAKNDFAIKLVNMIGKRSSIWLAENIGVKGLPVHYAARKKYIRDKLDNIANNISQVVMVGAGFDTLCLEYAQKYPQIKFFEIDQGATQQIKLDALNQPPANINFIIADLSQQSLQKMLEQNGFDVTAKSFFVIEGVLPYLEKPDVEKLFTDVGNSSSSGSYVVFGSMTEMEGNTRAKTSDAVLSKRKEKYKFAAKAEELNSLLQKAGFALKETKLYHELQQHVISQQKLKILKNERGEHYFFAEKK